MIRLIACMSVPLLLMVGPARAMEVAPPVMLPAAHAHNDYHHARPLLDALERGFGSVEVDIFLRGEKLLVGHVPAELDPARRLRTMYLDPLRERIEAAGGSVHGDGRPLTLLIDIKSDAQRTYARLHEVLAEYADILTTVEDGRVEPGPVRVVISGNRPVRLMREQPVRYAGYDGRLSDLDSDTPAHLMPLISDRWTSHFRWRGEGPISDAQREKLRSIVRRAHERDRRVRFWATPERESVWAELLDAGVDLIGTDDLPRLQQFLLAHRKQRRRSLRSNWLDPTGPVITIAHRGMWRHAPENSLASIQRAIDAGIPVLEIDIRQSKDDALILMHDATIDRTSDGHGRVDEMTLEQLRQYRLKGPDELTDQRIPTLREAMQLAGGRVLVNLDMKRDVFDAAIDVLRETNTTDSAIVKRPGNSESLSAFVATLPEDVLFMPLWFVRGRNAEAAHADLDRWLAHGRCSCVEFVFGRSIDDATIERFTTLCRRHGVRAWCNSLGKGPAGRYPDGRNDSWKRMIELGINCIQTDFPLRLETFLRPEPARDNASNRM